MKYIIPTCLAIAFSLFLSSFVTTSVIISGFVEDENGTGLIGVNILEQGSQNGVSTDIDGSFELIVDQLPVQLEITYPGYVTKILEVKNITESKDLRIKLSVSIEVLDEVVIISAGQKREKRMPPPSAQAYESEADFVGIKMGDISANRRMNSRAPNYHWSNPHLNSNSESYGTFQENVFQRPLDEALSTFSVDVDRASYSNVRRFLNQGQLPPTDAVRIEEMINYFKYDYPQPKGNDPISITPTVTACPWNSAHQLLHIGLQAKEIPTADLPPSNLVFLIDVSGSMSSTNKLPLVKSSMKMLLDELRPTDRVAIVTYAGHAGVVLESTSASEKSKIMKAIAAMDSGGSTAGAEGIITAYEQAKAHFMPEGNNRILLATDGDFNVGPSSNQDLERLIETERKSGVYLSILAFGSGNYQDDLMQTLAQAGNGNHAYIDNLQEAHKTLISEFGGTLFTVAKDVKIQIEFNPGKVAAYRLVGYESRMLKKEDFNNDKVDAGDMGAGHQVTAIYEIIPTGSKSEYLGKVDPLKYQIEKNIDIAPSDDIATVKFRYKHPKDASSKKVVRTISDYTNLKQTADDVQYAIATATFGMKLRNSMYIDQLDFSDILSLAKVSKGTDDEGYRAEMLRLIKSAESLTPAVLAETDGKE